MTQLHGDCNCLSTSSLHKFGTELESNGYYYDVMKMAVNRIVHAVFCLSLQSVAPLLLTFNVRLNEIRLWILK